MNIVGRQGRNWIDLEFQGREEAAAAAPFTASWMLCVASLVLPVGSVNPASAFPVPTSPFQSGAK